MLGICVVYLAQGPDGLALLDLAVAQLHRTTRGPFRIYGCCPDNDAATCRRLAGHGVAVQRALERNPDVSQEHSALLDALVDCAFADGCDAVATFDMDSWPVHEGWDGLYAALLTDAAPVAAIVRTELGDNFPFAAFTFLRAGFWRHALSSFSARQGLMCSPEGAALSSRPGETGSGILSQLHDEGLKFFRLERSNAWDPHPVIAAVYDGTIFHLGAGSRTPRFVNDEQTYRIGGVPARQRFADRMNEAVRDHARSEILCRHDDFIAALAGENRRPLRPIETDPRSLPRSLSLTPAGARAVLEPLSLVS